MRTYRVLMVLVGAAVIGYGVYGMLGDPQISDPLDVLVWAGTAVVLHDGLWLPLVCVIGAGVARDVVLRAGLVVAASLTVVALPAVLRADDDHGNPTLLPLHYQRNLLVLLGCCALGTALVWVIRRMRARRAHASRHSPDAKAAVPRS
jgi:hypothetical protein